MQRQTDHVLEHPPGRRDRGAYELLTHNTAEGVDRPLADRLLLETILDWCHAFYYRGNIDDLTALQERHASLAETVGDPSLLARWKAWLGLSLWLDNGAVLEPIAVLEESVAEAIACGDVTARGYASAWLSWLAWMSGDPQRSAALWPEVHTFVDQIPDPYDRRYVTLKTMAGASTGAALSLDILTATAWANELADIGTSTGNRRATSLGHLTLVATNLGLGKLDEAILAADRAVAVGADPVYAATAEAWATGIATFVGDTETAADWIERFDRAAQPACFMIRQQVDVFRAQVDVLGGDLSRGDKSLQNLRSALEAAGYRYLVTNIDGFYAATPARIASGEAEASTMQALRNPGFARRHGVRAAHKGRARLTRLIEIDEIASFTVLFEMELAKLEHSQAKTSQARAHAERVQELLADHPESTHYRDATELIARHTTKH